MCITIITHEFDRVGLWTKPTFNSGRFSSGKRKWCLLMSNRYVLWKIWHRQKITELVNIDKVLNLIVIVTGQSSYHHLTVKRLISRPNAFIIKMLLQVLLNSASTVHQIAQIQVFLRNWPKILFKTWKFKNYALIFGALGTLYQVPTQCLRLLAPPL